jgi:hypothetical protein
MTIRKNSVSRLLAAVGVTAIVAVGAVTPSLAATTNRAHHARDYDAGAYDARANDARAHDLRTSPALPRSEQRQWNGGGYFAHGAPDDPPGSAFQTFENDRSMGGVQ